MTKQCDVLKVLGQIFPNFKINSNWLPHLKESTPANLAQCIRRSDIPMLADLAAQAVGKGEHRSATNWIALGLSCYPDRMSDEIRRSGIFRSSKYGFHAGCLRRVIVSLLDEADGLALPEAFVRYMHSVSNLLRAAQAVREMDASLRRISVRRQHSVLKSVVALIDSLFMLDHQNDFYASSEDWKFYSNEDLAEAGSYIIHCFDDEIGMDDAHFNLLDEDGLTRGLYHKLLVKGSKIRHFLESELLVDAFDYRCTLRGRVLRISPPTPEFEKSIRLGFIQNEQSDQRDRIHQVLAIRQGQLSVFKAADQFYDQFGDRIARIVDWPIRRYVFMLPESPELRSFFAHDGLLVEERIYLDGILKAELVTWDELKRFEVAQGVSVFALLKVYRIFAFLRQVSKRCLKDVLKEEPALAYRSLVPVFSAGQMERFLGWCLPEDTISTVIEMLSWKSGAPGVVDLQYKPILQGERLYLTPMNITGAANWYRNLAYTQKKRVIDVAEEEAASRALCDAIGRLSQCVRKGFKTRIGGEDIEVDVLCRFGEYLFIFECKHAFLPCNVYELRTSYQYMQKGALTLNRILNLLSEEDAEAEIYRRLRWNVTPAQDIVTCIVSCNGMFPGLSISGHPIRRWLELRNIIETGIVRATSMRVVEDEGGLAIQEDDMVERNVWGGAALTPQFLYKYLREDELHKGLFGAMAEWERRYRLGSWELAFSTYALDWEQAKKNIEAMP